MNHATIRALYIILISLGLALTFNFLFFDKLIGISILIIVAILIGTVFLFGLYQRLSLRKAWWLIPLIFFFALMPGIRDNEFLTFLNLCATFGLLMLLTHELTGTPVFLMRLLDYFILITLVPLRMLGRALSTVTLLGQIHSNIKHRDMWLRVLKGAVMAVPVLIVFGMLFSQADLAFSQFIKSFVDINISERTIQFLVLLLFAFVATLGFLSYIFFPRQVEPELIHEHSNTSSRSGLPKQAGRDIEVMVFLGLISVLFLMFIGFQITYLFGGETNVIDAGFTYAEYARRGFWELLAVAILSLIVLLASEKYAGNRAQAEPAAERRRAVAARPSSHDGNRAQAEQSSHDGIESKIDKRFLMPAIILTFEVGIVIISAFKRLFLYIDAYGMTAPRFYAAGFIMLLSVLFVLLAVKFIKSKREQFFAFGALLSIAAFIILANLVNPDSFIAESNLKQYGRTGKIDIIHMGELSADAEPWKIELYKKLEGEDKELLRSLLQKKKDYLQKSNVDWQSTNLSRSRALKLLQEF